MTASTSRSSRTWTMGAGAAAVAACAVCCAGPLLAVLGGLGAAFALATVWIPALAVVAVAAPGGVVWVLRRRRAAACGAEPGVVDLGMPAPAPAPATAPDGTGSAPG